MTVVDRHQFAYQKVFHQWHEVASTISRQALWFLDQPQALAGYRTTDNDASAYRLIKLFCETERRWTYTMPTIVFHVASMQLVRAGSNAFSRHRTVDDGG